MIHTLWALSLCFSFSLSLSQLSTFQILYYITDKKKHTARLWILYRKDRYVLNSIIFLKLNKKKQRKLMERQRKGKS